MNVSPLRQFVDVASRWIAILWLLLVGGCYLTLQSLPLDAGSNATGRPSPLERLDNQALALWMLLLAAGALRFVLDRRSNGPAAPTVSPARQRSQAATAREQR